LSVFGIVFDEKIEEFYESMEKIFEGSYLVVMQYNLLFLKEVA